MLAAMPIDAGTPRSAELALSMMNETDSVVQPTAQGESFLIAAGGTGGHVIPALQVAAVLREQGHECVFVGTARGMENSLVPAAGFELRHVPIGPLNQVSWSRRLQTLIETPRALFAAWRLLDELEPAAVLSLGGYASGPLVLASALRDTPVVVMEPNAKPGMANRLAGMFASRALVGFEAAAKYFRNGISEAVGIPVRAEFFQRGPRRVNQRFTVLITGGSQGSRRLNEAAVGAARAWTESDRAAPFFIHQTGRSEFEQVRDSYSKMGFDADVSAFYDDMPALYAQADLIVCRAGASAVAELCAAGKASVLVPFPHAADNHQLINAHALANIGGAIVVEDGDWTAAKMAETLDHLRSSPAELATMGSAASGLAMPHAAERAADALKGVARTKGGRQ